MKQDAEKHADEDKQKRELIEAKNHAQGVVFELEKQLKEYGDKVDEKDRETIADNVKNLKVLVESAEATKEQLEKASEETLTSAQKLGEAMIKAQQAEQGAGAASTASEADGSSESKDANAKKKAEAKDAEEGEVIKD
mgnify:CR=1 FL=1